MYCKKCGNDVPEGVKYCPTCGEDVANYFPSLGKRKASESVATLETEKKENVEENKKIKKEENANSTVNTTEVKKTSKPKKKKVIVKENNSIGNAILALGVFGFIFALFNVWAGFLMSAVGIVFYLIKKPERTIGFSMCIITMVVSIVLLVVTVGLGISLNNLFRENIIAGEYECSEGERPSLERNTTLIFTKDGNFTYQLDGNSQWFATAKYKYEKSKNDHNSNYAYFTITVDGEKGKYTKDGKPLDHGFNDKIEFGIGKNEHNKKEGPVHFESTDSYYYCVEK